MWEIEKDYMHERERGGETKERLNEEVRAENWQWKCEAGDNRAKEKKPDNEIEEREGGRGWKG